jgi:hypothetical protein
MSPSVLQILQWVTSSIVCRRSLLGTKQFAADNLSHDNVATEMELKEIIIAVLGTANFHEFQAMPNPFLFG